MKDPLKAKFRPTDDRTDAEADAALEGLDLDALLDAGTKDEDVKIHQIRGLQPGKVLHIDSARDEVLVELPGRMQGLASFHLFVEEPREGDQIEINVERFDPAEGLYKLTPKGAAISNMSWEDLHPGTIVEGTVTGVNKGGLEVLVGTIRAFMPSGQVDVNFQPDLNVFINQRVTAEVQKAEKSSRSLVISRRALLEKQQEESREKLFKTLQVGSQVRGTVKRVQEFGAFADLGGADGLLHVSQLSYNRHEKIDDVVKVGDLVDVQIVSMDQSTGRIGLSLKALMADPWADADTRYPVGTTVTGRVMRLESFGAFVEVDEGLEALAPISELSWQRIRHPKEVVQEGQTPRFLVIAVDPGAKRMTLSLKQAGEDPWTNAEANYPRHSVVEGTVTRVADFGAFVELDQGVEGLVHVSELSDRRVNHPQDVVSPGQKISVRVLEIDPEQRRLSLSLKQVGREDLAAAASDAAAARKPAKPRNTKLRGGLDF